MRDFKKVSVVGAGAWGTSLAIILSKNVEEVGVWAREDEVIKSVEQERLNKMFLPQVKVPENVKFSNNAEDVLADADMVVWVVPVHFLKVTAEKFSKFIKANSIQVNAGKGIEIDTWLRPSQILSNVLPQASSCGSLMGPNIAYEVAQDRYAEAVVALGNHNDSLEAARLFCTPHFKVRASDDVVGVEIGAALKNIVALAAGFCDGMKLGANTKAIVMARGFQEIYRAAASLGAWSDSFIKESAILGDVLTTCMSPDSRNRTTGERLGEGMSAEEAKSALNGRVCAGLETIQICKMFEKHYHLKLPIMQSLCALAEGKIDTTQCLECMLNS